LSFKQENNNAGPVDPWTDLQNLHTHTVYCDGTLSAEEMVVAAIEKRCGTIGFSEHSNIWFVEDTYSMSPGTRLAYIREIRRLKEQYAGRIGVYLGIEQDYFTEIPADGFDYVIGAVHYVKKGDYYVNVDNGAGEVLRQVNVYYGGDFYEFAEDYYSTLSGIVKKTGAGIIGHFDVVAKNNFDGSQFDETHPEYIGAALCAMDEILKDCKLFEVNTGAMYRIGKQVPYPSPFFLKELCKRGGEVILSSDSHDSASLCYKYGEMRELLGACGFKYIKRLTDGGFTDVRI